MAPVITAFRVELKRDEERNRWHKKPSVVDWPNATTTFAEIARREPAHIGANVPPGLVVIDLDLYKAEGADLREVIEERFGLKLDGRSLLQTTISGGEHHVFAVDPKVKWRQLVDGGGIKGLDTRCAGRGWICTGREYIVVGGDFEARMLGPLTDPDWPKLPQPFLDLMNPRNPEPEKERAPVAGEERDRGPEVIEGAGRGTAGSLDELRSALMSIADDSYETWYRVAAALHSLPEGFSLFDEWSQKSSPEKYTPAATRRKWQQTASITNITLLTVWWLARESGWKPERGWESLGYSEGDFSAIGQEVAREALKTFDIRQRRRDQGMVRMPSFCLEGFIQRGAVSFAGQPGVGKTTTLVPLAAACTGGVAEGGAPAQPLLPMTVHYFAEDTLQAERCILAMLDAGLIPDEDAFFDRFNLYESSRRSPKEWVLLGENDWGERPLIVLDTVSANIDLDNENDASEVGRALFAIRQNVDASVWFVGHIAKSQNNTGAVSMRGSGAFAGDVQQVVTLTIDEDGDRLLQIAKHRFEFEDYGASADYVIATKTVDGVGVDDLEDTHDPITMRYNVLIPDDPAARMARKDLAKEGRKEEDRKAREQAMRAEIYSYLKANGPTKYGTLEGAVGGSNNTKKNAIEAMVAEGVLVEEAGPRGSRLFKAGEIQPIYTMDKV